jgi:hypothetical protein
MRQPLSGPALETEIVALAAKQAKYVGERATSWGGSAREALEVLLRATSIVLAVYEAAHQEAAGKLPSRRMKELADASLEHEIEEMMRTMLMWADKDAKKLVHSGAMFHEEHAIKFKATEETACALWFCECCGALLDQANTAEASAELKQHLSTSAPCRGHGVVERILQPGMQLELKLDEFLRNYAIEKISFFLGKHLMFVVKQPEAPEVWLTLGELREAFV